MAYQIGRANRLIDELELISNDGEVKAVVPVDINLQRIAGEYRAKMAVLMDAQRKVQQISAEGGDPAEAVTELGKGVAAAYTLIFGEDHTQAILNFFEGDYTEMVAQTAPYLRDVVAPSIQRYVKRQREQIAASHKRGLWGK